MARKRNSPNIRDVPAQAQVSATTVSHELNGRGRVQPGTRERIGRLAAEMGYVRRRVAVGKLVLRASTTAQDRAPA